MDLTARLRERRPEIEEAILCRANSVADPTELEDPSYVAGLRETVTVAVEYAVHALSPEGGPNLPIPSALFVQARQAARNGVSLDTVLRRYFAGYTLLGDFVLQETEPHLPAEEIQRVSRLQATIFDRVVVAVSEEYRRALPEAEALSERTQSRRVRALLAGELIDAVDLGYCLEGRWHLGAVATGPGAREALRVLSRTLDARLLAIEESGETWAWLGAERELCAARAFEAAAKSWPSDIPLALGEARQGIAGWRLTHRQAKAALAVALRGPRSLVHYTDVALLASVLRDDLLTASLHGAYLAPLQGERDGGACLRETLRAYFATERNVSSTAAALGVNRNTVASRLQAVSERICKPLADCAPQLELALRLHELEGDPSGRLPALSNILQAH